MLRTRSHATLRAGALITVLCGAFAGTAHAQCTIAPEDGTLVTHGTVRMAWRPEHGAIRVGEPFALLLRVCPAGAVPTLVDATMPEHRHGMNYRPTVQSLGHGMWRAEGLLWHMAGRWELRVDVRAEDGAHTLRDSLQLP